MDLLFLLGAVQSLFFATLLFSRTQIIFHHRILIAFFFLNGILLLDHFLEVKGIVFDHPHLLGLAYTLPLMIGPILYYYAIALTVEKRLSVSRFSQSIQFPLLFSPCISCSTITSFQAKKNWLITIRKPKAKLL